MDWSIALPALLIFCGGIYTIFQLIRGILLGIKSVSWPFTNGKITCSEINWSSDGEGGSIGSPEVSYVYEVCGRSYSADVISIGCGDLSFFRPCKKIVSKYPLGAYVNVYFDPSNPDMATLETGLSVGGVVSGLLIAIFGLCFGIGLFQNIFGR